MLSDALHQAEPSSSVFNLGPGFEAGEHPFVLSAALVPRTLMIQMWARHGDSISMKSYGYAVKPCMSMDNAGSSKDRLLPTTFLLGRVALFPRD